jgi:hypothetical protein
LVEEFSPEQTAIVRSVSDLVRLPQLQGRGILLDLNSEADWPAWHRFLLEFADAVRRSDIRPSCRAVFLLPRVCSLTERLPVPEVALRVHSWVGAVNRLDLQLWAAQLLAGTSEPLWQRQLRAAIAVELALWDTELCSQACDLTLNQLVMPMNWLASFGHARGIAPSDGNTNVASTATQHQREFEGRLRYHSAWLAVHRRQDVIIRRVWQAQLGVLFPLLENQRQELLVAHRNLWRLPWETSYGCIEQPEDLELNHLADQLRAQRHCGLREIYEFVCWLRDMRNDLAHLTPVPSERLLQRRFQSRFSCGLNCESY